MLSEQAYISGPLTGLPPEIMEELKRFYERIADVCEEVGYTPYLPHQVSDPILHKGLTPQQVDAIDRRAVTKASVVIAYVGLPSHGVAIEVEMANHAQTPVILLLERYKVEQKQISRLIRGNPAIRTEIHCDNRDLALVELKQALVELKLANKAQFPASLCLA